MDNLKFMADKNSNKAQKVELLNKIDKYSSQLCECYEQANLSISKMKDHILD